LSPVGDTTDVETILQFCPDSCQRILGYHCFVMRRLRSFRFCDMEVTGTKSLVYLHRKKSWVESGDRGGQSDIGELYHAWPIQRSGRPALLTY
ncbi:hypothetical protein ANN_00891, partial [Periplaneta americana]